MANSVEQIKLDKDPLDVWPDLLRYSRLGYDAIPPDDMLRMRWYGVYEQQPRAGHFMMRVRMPGGGVTAAQWRAMAGISRDFGRGIADITTRQNIQFHWLTIADLPEAIARLGAVGISTVGACGDITRNVLGCPVAGMDPHELCDASGIVAELERAFLGNRDFSNLPRKYKMAVAGCPQQCHLPEINDVGACAVSLPQGQPMAAGAPDGVAYHLRVGGGLSSQPRLSQWLDALLPPHQVAAACVAVAQIFRDQGYRERRNHARLKFLMEDWGPERFLDELSERLGFRPAPALPDKGPDAACDDHLGIHEQKQPGLHWVGLAVLTGRLSAEQMDAAADVAERFGAGELRATNQQNLIVPHIQAARLDDALFGLRQAGLRWDAPAIRRAAVACTGSEFCNLALTETKQRLTTIVERLEAAGTADEPLRINVNGCPNGCGRHAIADIGLQGCVVRVGEERVEAYDISLGGRMGADARFARPILRKAPAKAVHLAIERLLSAFGELRGQGEAFAAFVDRHTDAELAAFLNEPAAAPARAERLLQIQLPASRVQGSSSSSPERGHGVCVYSSTIVCTTSRRST